MTSSSDSGKVFRRLVSVEDALKIIFRHTEGLQIDVEEVDIQYANGRISAENYYSKIDVPGFDRAAFDGYAVVSKDTYGASDLKPVSLVVTGKVLPGEKPAISVKPGTAVVVATGSAIPHGADSVVMVEHTSRSGSTVLVKKPVNPGENIYPSGSDIAKGSLIVPRGKVMGISDIALLASSGYRKVKVYRKPVVAVISTGKELKMPGEILHAGEVYDVNTYTLASMLMEHGCKPLTYGIVPDRLENIKEVLLEALRNTDLVLISGSSSAGPGDIVYKAVEVLGGEILVHGVAAKPGKPFMFGVVGGKPVFGLPGYPVSCLISFLRFEAPLLSILTGKKYHKFRSLRAKLSRRVYAAKGRRHLVPVAIVKSPRGEEITVTPVPGGSGTVSLLSLSDGYIEVPEMVEYVEKGDTVMFTPFGGLFSGLTMGGPWCPTVESMIGFLYDSGVPVRLLRMGRVEPIEVLKAGGLHIAGYPRVNGETRYPGCVMVGGFRRRLGLIFRDKNFQSFQELVGLTIGVGGEGRYLHDILIRKAEEFRIDESAFNVRVYRTLSSAIGALMSGDVDAVFGFESAAVGFNLSFSFLLWDMYEFYTTERFLNVDLVKRFIRILNDNRFRSFLKGLPGVEPLQAQVKTGENL